ncbi:hypothetical protein [Altericista sp. CCNU0014]|uniref:hypothetical protein n=1 Tax=Altericista sp. CCNU0014 TaxID=3082949 RepID=UPI00384E736F
MLEKSNFPSERVTIVKQEVASQDEGMAISEEEFVENQKESGVKKSVLTAGAVGGVSGMLMGLGALMLPGIGSVAVLGIQSALVGMATGGVYGTAAGTLMGAALGEDISHDRAKQYGDRLAEGNYLMIVEGSKDEISSAESILKASEIKDWGIY